MVSSPAGKSKGEGLLSSLSLRGFDVSTFAGRHGSLVDLPRAACVKFKPSARHRSIVRDGLRFHITMPPGGIHAINRANTRANSAAGKT